MKTWQEYNRYIGGITNVNISKAGYEAIQQDAIQSLSAKLPDKEVKRIAEKCFPKAKGLAPDIIESQLAQLQCEQAILEALSLVKQGDNQELLEDKKRLDWLENQKYVYCVDIQTQPSGKHVFQGSVGFSGKPVRTAIDNAMGDKIK